ncbi:type VI secretion system tube protein Hcp [Nostoc sp. 3335mG]|nr:type VI secretion system tube protein Hcp [Nostoc sp. 3335mG]
MAIDIFLRVDGIEGESTDDKHKNEIDILAWSWGITQSGTTHMGPGAGSGKASIQDITLTKYVDKATHALIKACTSGKHIASADLTVRKAGGDSQVEYIKIKLKEIIVTSYTTGGSSDGLDRITETLSFNFAEFVIDYTQQTKEGTAGAKVSAGWNAAKNVAV